jgi:hypothetical protein
LVIDTIHLEGSKLLLSFGHVFHRQLIIGLVQLDDVVAWKDADFAIAANFTCVKTVAV